VRTAPLFHDDLDRRHLLDELRRSVALHSWRCVAYCLMTTHFHFLVDVPRDTLHRGMHAINFRYAMAFNIRHGTRGHVFSGRYFAKRIEDPEYLLTAFRYIARNPTDAKLCGAPGEWRWSSYGAAVGLGAPIPFVNASDILGEFHPVPELAVAALRSFVEEP
jgi:REP element-mobilizing transposase RayT